MKPIYFLAAALLPLFFCSCSKDSDNKKDKIEHSVRIQFVDSKGFSIINNQTYEDNTIRIVYFDSEGEQHNFFNEDWFAMNGYTVDRFNDYTFTVYLTLPENGETVTETYMSFYDMEPDVFTAEYEVKRGKNEDEPYGGGSVKVQRVKLNGVLIWDRKEQSEVPYKMIRTIP